MLIYIVIPDLIRDQHPRIHPTGFAPSRGMTMGKVQKERPCPWFWCAGHTPNCLGFRLL